MIQLCRVNSELAGIFREPSIILSLFILLCGGLIVRYGFISWYEGQRVAGVSIISLGTFIWLCLGSAILEEGPLGWLIASC